MRIYPLVAMVVWSLGSPADTLGQTLAPPGTAPRPGVSPAPSKTVDTGTVSGQVRDARSRGPLVNALVQLIPVDMTREHLKEPQPPGRTDHDGRFEIRLVSPGRYRVLGSAPGYPLLDPFFGSGPLIEVVGGSAVSGVDVPLQRGAIISGRIFDEQGNGLDGVEIEVRKVPPQSVGPTGAARAETADDGWFQVANLGPGRYLVRAFYRVPTRRVDPDRTVAYSPTYFPNAVRRDHALPLIVTAGAEVGSVDFALAVVDPVDVTGVVLNAPVDLVRDGTVVLYRPDVSGPNPYQVPLRADGRFHITGVIPGDYTLTVRRNDRVVAARAVSIEHPVDDIQVIVPRRVAVTGRIVNAGSHRLTLAGGVRVSAVSRLVDEAVFLSGADGPVTADGRFSLPGVTGVGTLRVSGLPEGWVATAVRLSMVDVTDTVTDFARTDGQRFEIVVTDQPTRITGRVVDRETREPRVATVLIFPADHERWGLQSEAVRTTFSVGGEYDVTGLVPGEYLAIAFSILPPVDLRDPSVLRALWNQATPFRVDNGEHQILTLQPSRFPPSLLQ